MGRVAPIVLDGWALPDAVAPKTELPTFEDVRDPAWRASGYRTGTFTGYWNDDSKQANGEGARMTKYVPGLTLRIKGLPPTTRASLQVNAIPLNAVRLTVIRQAVITAEWARVSESTADRFRQLCGGTRIAHVTLMRGRRRILVGAAYLDGALSFSRTKAGHRHIAIFATATCECPATPQRKDASK